MSKSLFQQYEEHRKLFFPGTIHKRKADLISILEIKIMEDRSSSRAGKRRMVEILKVEGLSSFFVGERLEMTEESIQYYFTLKKLSNV